MTSTHHSRVKELLLAAADLAPAERAALLDRECTTEPSLRAEVEDLLELDALTGDDFLRAPERTRTALVGGLDTGDRLGGERHYRLVRLLGEGGMGRVFLAERADGEFRQEVAIKLLSWFLGGDENAARRFRSERQILARLTHPNIARLLDGGTTTKGQPFLVMERVDGVPVDEFVENNRLALPELLRLFLKICAAVQVAHQNLVVHRDLKPGNILVTADGEPKLLDFGIAKLLSTEAAGDAAETRRGEALLTPRYASPEQVRGEAIGTSSDIYSLGVILYELLAGQAPYNVTLTAPAALVRAICETEPTALSSLPPRSDTRGSDRIPRDLDAIVLKALRKEPGDRYSSVEALAEDIERFLDGRPVAARRGGRTYRLQRFARRHRWALVAAAVFLCTVAAFIVGLERQLRETARQRDAVARERDRATAVTDFMVGLFTASDPAEARGHPLTALEILERGTTRVESELASEPELRATVFDALGRIYRHLGEPARGVPLLEKALALLRAASPAPREELYAALHHLGLARLEASRFDEAQSLLEEALAMRGKFSPSPALDFSSALSDLAMLHTQRGEFAPAAELMAQVVESNRTRLGPESPEVAISELNLASLYFRQGDLVHAEPLCVDALRILKATYPGDHPDVAFALSNLAAVTSDKRRALPLLEEAVAMRRRLLGDRHPDVGTAINNLAVTLYWLGDYARAEPLLREALSIWLATYGEEAAITAAVKHNLGQTLLDRGDPAAARPWFEAALDVRERTNRPRDPDLALTRTTLGQTLCMLGDTARGEALLRQGIEVQREVLAADSQWRTKVSLLRLARCLDLQGRRAEAATLVAENLPEIQQRLGENHPFVQHFSPNGS
ncbi:MAG: serine/threonine-protein kinase [Thermoanaerobaculia bacterium]